MRFTSGGVEPSDVEIGPDRVEMDGGQADRTKDANCAGAEAAQDKKSGCCCPEGHLILMLTPSECLTKCLTMTDWELQHLEPDTVARLFFEDTYM